MAIERGGDGWRLLVRHDRMIVGNELRSAFRSWADRLLAVGMVPIAFIAVRAWAADQPFVRAAVVAAALCALIGAGAARLAYSRLDFHATDGVLAACALAAAARRFYVLVVHGLALAMLIAAALVIRPSLAAPAALAYLAGAALAHLAAMLFGRPTQTARPAIARRLAAFGHRPLAGLPAAIATLVPALFPLDAVPLVILTGLVAAVLSLCLTTLDHATIRFMTFSGHGGWHIIGQRARGTLVMLAIAAPVALILSKPVVAGTIGAVAIAALALMAVRILVYRLYARRRADMMVSIGTTAVALVGVAAPFLLPVIAIVLFRYLQRRSAAATWVLA